MYRPYHTPANGADRPTTTATATHPRPSGSNRPVYAAPRTKNASAFSPAHPA